MAITTEQQEKLNRYNELFYKSRTDFDNPLSREEGNELAKLQQELSDIQDSELKAKKEEIEKKANEESRRLREKSRKTNVSAAEDIAEDATKLAFDKEKKPNLTVASSCYLRRNLHIFIQDSFNKNPLGWTSFMCWHADQNMVFGSGMNGYIGDGSAENQPDVTFLNLKGQDYTKLKPKIRLFKTINDSSGKIVNEIEMSFPTDGKEKIATELLMPSTSDAGIKRVQVDFKNQNPFASGRMVDVQMEILLSGGEAFTRPRGFKGGIAGFNTEDTTYSIKDLLLRGSQLDPAKYDGHFYGIKMVVGYEEIEDTTLKPDIIGQNDIAMILQLVEYDLNIQQNGTLSLILQYKGRVESVFEDRKKYDIFDFQGGSRSEIVETATSIGDANRRLEELKNKLDKREKELLDIGIQLKNTPDQPTQSQTVMVAGEVEIVEPSGQNSKKRSLESASEATKAEILKIKAEQTQLNEEKTALEKEYNALTSENKILKYSRILDKMNQEKKIYNIVLNLTELILYGSEFRAALQRRIDIINNDTKKTEEQKALEITALERTSQMSKQERNTVVKKQIAEQSQSGGSFISKLQDAIRKKAEETAKAEGREGELTEEDFKTAAQSSEISAVNFLESVSAVKPAEGTPDSDPSMRSKKRIYYFYYGDLLDTALRLNPNWQAEVYTQMEYDRNGVIIGPALCESGDGDSLLSFNIADVPIPVELYQEFFNKNVINRDIDQYNAADFIKDTLYQLVAVFLNQKCTGESVRYPVSVQVSPMSVGIPPWDSEYYSGLKSARQKISGKGDYDKYPNLDFDTNCPIRLSSPENLTRLVSVHQNMVPKVNQSYNNRFFLDKRSSSWLHQLRIYAKKVSSSRAWSYNLYSLETLNAKKSSFRGNREEDAASGIHHLYVGNDRGLVKSINFSKVKNPALTAMMVKRAHERKEENIELWSIFNLDIKMIGNSIFKPGMHLYLNPTIPGFGDPRDTTSLSRTLGLGGYYLVISVSNNFIPNWETSVQAVFVSSPVTKQDKVPEILQPIQAKPALGAAVDNVLIIDAEGKVTGTSDTLTIIKKSTSASAQPKGKGQPLPVQQQLNQSYKELQLGDPITSPELSQLSAGTGFTSVLDKAYQRTQQQVVGGNNYSYEIENVNSEIGSQQVQLETFFADYENAKLDPNKYKNEGKEFTLQSGKKAKMITFNNGEVNSQRTALLIYNADTENGGTSAETVQNAIILSDRTKEE